MFKRNKVGTIHSVIPQDNIGFITEEYTGTKFMFFIDDVKKQEVRNLVPGTQVTFHLDTDYSIEEFMATNVSAKTNYQEARKVV